MKIFIDTSALVALSNKKDIYHRDSIKKWDILLKASANLYITNYIFSETITLLRMRAGYHISVEAGDSLISSKFLNIIYVNKAQELNAWRLYKKFLDKDLSFVDCISFSVMEELSIKKAFTFDEHFLQVGYEPL